MILFMFLRREVVVKRDSEVATVWGGGEGGVIYGEAEAVRDLGLMMTMSDLSHFSWRKLVYVWILTLVSAEREAVVMDLLEM